MLTTAEIEDIARTNALTAFDQAEAYDSLGDAVYAYSVNATDSVAEAGGDAEARYIAGCAYADIVAEIAAERGVTDLDW